MEKSVLAVTGSIAAEERECPFCAETILKTARVCKHCRHDVEPLAADDIAPPAAPSQTILELPISHPQASNPIAAASLPPVAATLPSLRTAPEPLSTMKFVMIAAVALILVGAGAWYFSHSGPFPPPNVTSPSPVAAVSSGTKPRVGAPGAEVGLTSEAANVNPMDGLKYVWIPPGTFMMGCSPGDTECADDEKPQHPVTIAKGLWMGQTEVTVGAYKGFAAAMGKGMPKAVGFNPGGSRDWSNELMPMGNVTWDDAQAYCSRAGGRLPTEAEWEYAARAGSTESRYGVLDEIAWYADNSGRERLDFDSILREDRGHYLERFADNNNTMHEVGQKRANGFGLYDMLGNAEEWVNGWSDKKYYQKGPSQDPSGPTGSCCHVQRGGSWSDTLIAVRVSRRVGPPPAVSGVGDGFRCGGEMFAAVHAEQDAKVEAPAAERGSTPGEVHTRE